MKFHTNAVLIDEAHLPQEPRKRGASTPVPIAMTISDALVYTGFSKRHIDELISQGKLERRRLGPKGAFILLRKQLDAAVDDAFNEGSDNLEGDFRFA